MAQSKRSIVQPRKDAKVTMADQMERYWSYSKIALSCAGILLGLLLTGRYVIALRGGPEIPLSVFLCKKCGWEFELKSLETGPVRCETYGQNEAYVGTECPTCRKRFLVWPPLEGVQAQCPHCGWSEERA